LKSKLKAAPNMEGLDLVKDVTCEEVYKWEKLDIEKKYSVAVLDFGIKHNIIPVNPSSHNLEPCKRGDNIYIYTGKSREEFYGSVHVKQIEKQTKAA
jgi:hypothetical protein